MMGIGIPSEVFHKQAKKKARKELVTELVQHLRKVTVLKKKAVKYSVYAIVDLLVAVFLIVPDGLSDGTKAWLGILSFAIFAGFAVLTLATRSKIHLEYKKAILVFYEYGYEKRKDDIIDDEIGHLFGFNVPKKPSVRYKDILDIQKDRIDKKHMEVGFAKRLFDYYLEPVLHKH